MLKLVLWLILFVLCWPLALLALLLVAGAVAAYDSVPHSRYRRRRRFEFLRAIIFLPARLLGGGPPSREPSRR